MMYEACKGHQDAKVSFFGLSSDFLVSITLLFGMNVCIGCFISTFIHANHLVYVNVGTF